MSFHAHQQHSTEPTQKQRTEHSRMPITPQGPRSYSGPLTSQGRHRTWYPCTPRSPTSLALPPYPAAPRRRSPSCPQTCPECPVPQHTNITPSKLTPLDRAMRASSSRFYTVCLLHCSSFLFSFSSSSSHAFIFTNLNSSPSFSLPYLFLLSLQSSIIGLPLFSFSPPSCFLLILFLHYHRHAFISIPADHNIQPAVKLQLLSCLPSPPRICKTEGTCLITQYHLLACTPTAAHANSLYQSETYTFISNAQWCIPLTTWSLIQDALWICEPRSRCVMYSFRILRTCVYVIVQDMYAAVDLFINKKCKEAFVYWMVFELPAVFQP